MQGDVANLLLLQKDHDRFTTSVLIHGMGGTGKTVTAVAVLQRRDVRATVPPSPQWTMAQSDRTSEPVTADSLITLTEPRAAEH